MVERVITEHVSWDDNISAVVGKAQQCLYFTRRVRKQKCPQNLYRWTIKSIHTTCDLCDCQVTQMIVATELPSLDILYTTQCVRSTRQTHKDSQHTICLNSFHQPDMLKPSTHKQTQTQLLPKSCNIVSWRPRPLLTYLFYASPPLALAPPFSCVGVSGNLYVPEAWPSTSFHLPW